MKLSLSRISELSRELRKILLGIGHYPINFMAAVKIFECSGKNRDTGNRFIHLSHRKMGKVILRELLLNSLQWYTKEIDSFRSMSKRPEISRLDYIFTIPLLF